MGRSVNSFTTWVGHAEETMSDVRVTLPEKDLWVAVQRTAGGRVDELLDAASPGRFQEAQRTENVNVAIVEWVFSRFGDTHLGRQMEHYVRLFPLEDLGDRRLSDVQVVKRCGRVQVFQLAGAQVVDDDHLVVQGKKPVNQVGADEPGASGYQDGFRLGHQKNQSPRKNLADMINP